MKSEMPSPAIQEQMQTVKKLRIYGSKKVITIGRELCTVGSAKDFALRGFASFLYRGCLLYARRGAELPFVPESCNERFKSI